MSSGILVPVDTESILYVRPGREGRELGVTISYRGQKLDKGEAWMRGLQIVSVKDRSGSAPPVDCLKHVLLLFAIAITDADEYLAMALEEASGFEESALSVLSDHVSQAQDQTLEEASDSDESVLSVLYDHVSQDQLPQDQRNIIKEYFQKYLVRPEDLPDFRKAGLLDTTHESLREFYKHLEGLDEDDLQFLMNLARMNSTTNLTRSLDFRKESDTELLPHQPPSPREDLDKKDKSAKRNSWPP